MGSQHAAVVGQTGRSAGPLDKLRRLHRGLCRDLQRADERAYVMGMAIAALERAFSTDASGRLSAAAGLALQLAEKDKSVRAAEAAARAQAEGGVRRLELRAQPSGGASVRVDEGKWFVLPEVLANLLWVLSSVVESGADGFPVWQTVETVVDQIERKASKTLTRRALTQAVYRLRGLFVDNGMSPYLLQVDRRRGLRFLVRRETRWP